VQGTNNGSRPFCANLPILIGWNPSTSFSMLIDFRTSSSSRWLGNGNCTKMPSTRGSAFNSLTNPSTSSWVAVAGSVCPKDSMPASAQAFCFELTYTFEAGLSPTNTVAKPGTRNPFSFNLATSSAACWRTCCAKTFPSIIVAVITHSFYSIRVFL